MFMITPEDWIKLILAVLVGGVVGFEREIHSKAAGLRTLTLITIGATLFTMLSLRFNDADRVAANIVSGVGFLGAGAILLSEGRVKGLTTASSIWVSAALGMAIGIGQYELAGAGTMIVIIVLWLFTRVDRWIDLRGREIRTYEISFVLREGKSGELDKLFDENGLTIVRQRQFKSGDLLIGEWEIRGPLGKHHQFIDKVLFDPEVKQVKY